MLDFEGLARRAFGESAELERVDTLKGDASARTYHRMILSGTRPGSAIVMELPPDPHGSDEGTNGQRPIELPFLNVGRHMAAANLPVPEIYLDGVDGGALVLEDLGDETLVRRIEGLTEEQVERWYEAAVDLMIRMHRDMWPVPADCLASSRSFDFDLLRWELDHYREWGVEAVHGTLDPGVRGRLDDAFDSLAREIAALPRGFVHRDYQSRNLMVAGRDVGAESLRIIDFQDALGGPRVYDLVALLNDSYVNLSRELQERIICRYATGAGIACDEVMVEFDLVTAQRKLKDGGRFIFIDKVKNNPDFLPFVDVSFGRVRSALSRIPGHQALKEALAEAHPQHFGF